MRVGVFIDETWDFFREIYTDLSDNYQVSLYKLREIQSPVFRERINRYIRRKDLLDFIRNQDVLFFEWASELLVEVNDLPKITPIVTRIHRYELYQFAKLVNWDAVDKVILVTKAKQREFSRQFPDHATKTIVIPEAVSLDRFTSKIKPYNGDIGILCHLTPRKRVYELILAFADLLDRDPGYNLHIGGDEHELYGDYYEAITGLVRGLGLQENVRFYGQISDPENWYRNVDILISNSYSEGLQVSPMEAIASGCYCLCHRWDGADEFYPEENLYLRDREMIDKIIAYGKLSQVEKAEKIIALQAIIKSRFNVDQTKVEIRNLLKETAGHDATTLNAINA